MQSEHDAAAVTPTIRTLAPGLVGWTVPHPRIGVDVSSYLLTEPRVLLDPMTPPEGLEWFEANDLVPSAIVLTNRHHWRCSADFAARFGCAVHVSRPGLMEFGSGHAVEPFDFGDRLPGGMIAHEVGAICPDETALEITTARALAVGDGVNTYDGLGFAPDEFIDDPEVTKRALRRAYEHLVAEVRFEHLLVAHGEPILGDGRAQLRDWTGRGS